jgi:hypothetical protein
MGISQLYTFFLTEFGLSCAMLICIVLPLLIPVVFLIEYDSANVTAGLVRGLKLFGILSVTAAAACVASIVKKAAFQSFIDALGVAIIYAVILGAVFVFTRDEK